MPSSLNSLLIAWALTLIILGGGFFYIESRYHAQIEDDATTQNTPDPAPDQLNGESSDSSEPIVTSDGRPDRVTTLPRPEEEAFETSRGETDNEDTSFVPAPGETVSSAPEEQHTPSKDTLINPPNPDLIENSRNGPLPQISTAGEQPATYYAAPTPADSDRPRIALLVTDLGAIERRTTRALDALEPTVSLGFTPYAADLSRWTAVARAKGYEYFLMIPMEPVNAAQNDPGPLG